MRLLLFYFQKLRITLIVQDSKCLTMKLLYTKNLIFLLLFSSTLFAQDIVLKLKPEFQDYLSSNTIANKRLKSLFDAMNVRKVESILKVKHPKATSLDRTYSLFLADNQYKNAVATALLQSGYFEYVQVRETKTITPLHLPNDPFAQPTTGSQYYLDKINAYKAWDISKGDTNVVVCIVDNGIEATHPEFQNKIKYNAADPVDGIDNDKDGYVDNYMGWDIANDDAIPEDSTGAVAHGTEVSALAAGLTNNGIGIASVGYNCKFIPVKIFNNTSASGNKAYEAVIYAVQHGCKVINMSWGSIGGFDQYEQAVMNYAAIDNDVVLVGASYPQDGMVFTTPADYENVLSVAAIRPNDLKAIPQATHYWIDLSAPSIDVFTANINGGYRYNSGVSLGVPLVTGAAALARSVYPWMNSTQIQELLRVTATNIDTIGTNKNYKEKMGYGRLDVYKALSDTTIPAIRISEYSLHALNGDTVSMELGFKNYLWPSKNLKFDFRQINGGFEIYDSTTTIGIVKMGDSAATPKGSIKFRILPFTSANSSELIRIGISDSANHYIDYQYFYLDKKSVIPLLITKNEISDLSVLEEFKLFPNPCNENLFIEFEEAEEVSITELSGKKMAIFSKPSEIVSVNMKDWPAGVYLAHVRTLNGSFTKKFLKK